MSLSAVSRFLSRAAMTAAGAGLVGVTLIIGWQVFARYVLNAAPAWSEQAALVLMVWFVLFAAAAGVRERFHIRLTMLTEIAPRPIGKAMEIASHCVVAGFGVALLVYGGQLVLATWAHTVPTLGALPRGASYLAVPISGAMMAVFSVEHICAALRGEKVEPLWT